MRDLEDISVWEARRLQLKAKRHANVLQRLWWWFVGMPPANVLEERLEPPVFTEDEESRIREIVREES